MAFTVGSFETTDEMRALVKEVLDSGRISYGPLSRRFERQFAKMHGCNFGVLSNSGTSSLHVALQAMKEVYGWQDGDEVIVPALTFVATVNIVYHCRLTPVLVDVDPAYYSIDPTLISEAITARTRCIIPVHPFGLPANMREIKNITRNTKIKIIEDSCEAMFVHQDGQWVGSMGDIGCFSTYVAHMITGGVGGIATTNDGELALVMRSLVNHGIDLFELPAGAAYEPTFLSRNFSFSRIGHSFRVTELEAALLLPQLQQAHDIIRARKENALRLYDIWGEYRDFVHLPATRSDSSHAFMVFPLVMRYHGKQGIMRHLRASGIEVRDALPLTNQPCYDFNPARWPVAQRINERGFYIGCHPGLTDEDFSHLEDVLERYFKGKNA